MVETKVRRNRSKSQKEADQIEIAKLYLKGTSQAEIAAILKINQSTVSRDLEVIWNQWRLDRPQAFDDAKSTELAKIDALERTYWDAWERSLQPKDTMITGKVGEAIKAQKRTEQRSGNPTFLSGVQWCIERRIKLLGLDAPALSEVKATVNSSVEFNPEQMSSEQLRAIANG